ncbi:MAG: tetratricopeptide repeat protein [Azospirillaceae bacterium]|nr:tetratricopeptide repeat protein [Azospirillaceae bacterium]
MTTLADILQQGIALHQAGRLDEAEPLYRQVLAAVPGQPDTCRLLGALYLQGGRPALAIAPLRAVLTANPDHAEALNNLRVAYAALGQVDQAVAFLRELVVARPQAVAPALVLATTLWQAGRPAEAVPHFRQVVALAPGHADGWVGLARCLDAVGLEADDGEEADAAYGRAIALTPQRADLLAARGGLRDRQGRFDDAVVDLEAALALDGGVALYHYNLGHALQGAGRWDAALTAYERALALDPGLSDALLNLANTLMAAGRAREAVVRYLRLLAGAPAHAEGVRGLLHALLLTPELPDEARRALETAITAEPGNVTWLSDYGALLLERGLHQPALDQIAAALALDPDSVPTLSMMGVLLDRVGRVDDAAAFHERAVELGGDQPGILNNMGLHHQTAGRGMQAIAYFARSLTLAPSPSAHSNLIFAHDFDPAIDIATGQAERRRWYDLYGPEAAGGAAGRGSAPWPPAPWANLPDPDRPLTIGYVSADFRSHSAAACFSPVVCGHDRAAFRVICYSNYVVTDQVTDRIRAAVDGWRVIVGMDDAAVDRLVREDGVDILVDLSGHSGGNRLTLFAAKPAPVQVSAWGHVTGTGIPAMDALLADPELIPAVERPFFAEQVMDLPCSLCFEPPPDCPPVAPGPATTGGPLTFGCFNRLAKVTDDSLDLWAMGLRLRPETRLVMKDTSLENPALRADLTARLARRGVAPERVELLGRTSRADHLAAYGRIDVALDPVTYSGGVTSCEALWMGVPVLALPAGLSTAARSTAAILRAVGMTDYIVRTPEALVARMAELADDPMRVAAGRLDRRARLARTPVFDTAAYTRAVEGVYRQLWRDWCEAGVVAN